ncbi:uncharacterized protein Z519_11989 [Cladophialophora bantiana CBS 173.52]|uniref:Uncharacterized protein n=1 Tax=Cladophialophora bantiana (strain ATCC 10958 / CBS 173.52 / CDC B-1940 / NIH 8579) TaxID=1442370 RepID=A0A0D2H224_CLAB1|nr:uncharacterized protein Z519_11989 [Cladophialophora bantiana CBS 173.52]KIW87353.1 hypothetical protein Z519_11989 [Cladophialophora bantiana CBS 173.52]
MATQKQVLVPTATPEKTALKSDLHDKKPNDHQGAKITDNTTNSKLKFRLPPKVKAWVILLSHLAVCTALALSIALAINGYEALDDDSASHATYVDGKLILRVADVTTIVSAALVIVKLLVGAWSTLTVWACGHYLLSATTPVSTTQDPKVATTTKAKEVSWMVRWKLPPWIHPRHFNKPKNPRQWVISVALLMTAVQTFIAPIITGAVNWTSTPVPTPDARVSVAAVDSTADFGGWKWYNYPFEPFGLDRKPYLRTAAGYASLVWSDQTTMSANGTSLTGNGCRHVVQSHDMVGPNSTLLNATVPCIRIHSLEWYKADYEVPRAEWVYVADSSSLSIVDDPPSSYYRPGMAVVFDDYVGWNKSQDWYSKPAPTIFSKVQTVGMMVKRVANQDPPCSALDPTIFGSVDHLDRYLLNWGDSTNGNCYFIGRVNFTAGVTISPQSKYVSNRVVEDQTPLDEVVFVENPWVQEAVWLLPDLMTMIAVMNSTLLPTFDNINHYVELLMCQAYLAAWDMYHDSFDEDQKGLAYTAIPSVSRQLAEVSFARVFAWLAICALMTIFGALLLVAVLGGDDLTPAEEDLQEAREERHGEETEGFIDVVYTLLCG